MSDPFHIQWHITNLCNLRCKHCYQDDFSKKCDLDRVGLKKVADNLLATMREWNKTACIHLTGGEPLLKSELFYLLRDLDVEPGVKELGIITNGTLLDEELMKKLSAFSKLKKIKISLDGATSDINDSIRPQGTFDKVIENLTSVKKSMNFEITFMFTVMKKNFRSLPSLFHLCQNLGAEGLIIERFIPWGRGRERMDEVLSKEDWKELVGTLLELFSVEMEEDDVFPYQAFQVIFGGEEAELQGAPCVAGRDGLCVMPDGNVFPCRRFPVPTGNLLENPLKAIWEESEILKKLREKENLKGKCGRCAIRDCRGCRSLALCLTGDYLEEDSHCWHDP